MVVTKFYAAAAALAGLAHAAAGATNGSFDAISASSDLNWCPCGPNFFCAKLKVPLDYKNPGQGHASVPLKKYAAANNSTDGPYQGMVVLIPGGPGGSGIDLLGDQGSLVQTVVGSNWDIVSYDPRGIFRSEPALDCAVNASSPSGNKTRRDAVPRLADSYYSDYMQYGKAVGDRCAQRSGSDSQAGPHMSTAVNARDLLSLVDAYARTADGHRAAKKSNLLNFYAVSYGTVVGQTFASMFPQRVGHAVLDGVIGPESYLSSWTKDAINHMDGVLASYFIYCSKAGPKLCPYATGSSAKDTFARFKASFKQLDAKKAEAQHWSNATDIAEALLTLKFSMLNAAYMPLQTFSDFSKALIGLEGALGSGQLKQWTQQVIAGTQDPGPAGDPDAPYRMGVLCSDQNDGLYGKTVKDLQPTIQGLEKQSIIGEAWMKNELECTGWNIKAKERFTGPFGGDTATPMIFMSNTFDPVAPIENSKHGAPKYKNAQILTIDGTGHTSAATNNTCAFAKLHAYFQKTQLPGKDNSCPTEGAPFDVKLNGKLQDAIQKAGLADLHF